MKLLSIDLAVILELPMDYEVTKAIYQLVISDYQHRTFYYQEETLPEFDFTVAGVEEMLNTFTVVYRTHMGIPYATFANKEMQDRYLIRYYGIKK